MLDRSLFDAITLAVAKAGGDADDVLDLIDVWRRLDRVQAPRAAAMRRRAAAPRCSCADGGDELTTAGQCTRCFGWPQRDDDDPHDTAEGRP